MRKLCTAVAALTIAFPAAAAPKLRAWVTTGDKSQLMAARAPSGPASAKAVEGLPLIAVDPNERHQTIVGFGAAITDASAFVLHTSASLDEGGLLAFSTDVLIGCHP